MGIRRFIGRRADTDTQSEVDEKAPKTIYGVRFPVEAYAFVAIGALSEVVDALFMVQTLNNLNGGYGALNAIIASIIGAGCFISMAFVGFQRGNRKYYSKFGVIFSYLFWACSGVALVMAKLLSGLVATGDLSNLLDGTTELGAIIANQAFLSQAIIAIVQLVLYVGTGFMTRDSVEILTDNDMREYQFAKRRYEELLDELAEKRGDIAEDVSKLKSYHKIAERLVKSKKSVERNVAQYNKAARAIVESKMSITVSPDYMEEMYDHAMEKERKDKE